jgi:hypothetical protein
MQIILNIPDYNQNDGIISHWENNFQLIVTDSNNQVLIQANKAALTSLAIQLLTLAQDSLPSGGHLHFDEYNSLENGSKELIIEKM